MSILIIGGAGYIDSNTVKYFIEQNEDIIYSRQSTNREQRSCNTLYS